MDSTRLLYFKSIAELNSLSQASKQLHISQPALSKSLSSLESELGVSLFNRIGGRLYLNSDGKALLEYANQLDYLFHQIQDRFETRSDPLTQLSLYSIGNYFPFILKNYFSHDTTPLNLMLVRSQQVAEALFSGDADVVIADDRYLEESPALGLKRIPLLNEQLFLMIPKNHELSGKTQIRLDELKDYPIMKQASNSWLEEIEQDNQIELKLSWSVDSSTWEYYWSNYSEEMPLCFDTSASFVTQEALKVRRRRCTIAAVTGKGTNRMVYLWFFERNEKKLSKFLNCVKTSFTR